MANEVVETDPFALGVSTLTDAGTGGGRVLFLLVTSLTTCR